MMYPFKWNVGDHVEVCDGHYRGFRGQVRALELSTKKTIAVLSNNNGRSIRQLESNLRQIPRPQTHDDVPF